MLAFHLISFYRSTDARFPAVEYVPKQRRMLVLSAFRFVYPVVGVFVPWIAYASGYWRTLQLLNVVPCCIAAPLSYFIPESSRWLLSKGKLEETKQILHKIARWNGNRVDPNAFDTLEVSIIRVPLFA